MKTSGKVILGVLGIGTALGLLIASTRKSEAAPPPTPPPDELWWAKVYVPEETNLAPEDRYIYGLVKNGVLIYGWLTKGEIHGYVTYWQRSPESGQALVYLATVKNGEWVIAGPSLGKAIAYY